MTTFDIDFDDVLRLVGPGPHVINLPRGEHGRQLSFGTADELPVDITVNADGEDWIRGQGGILTKSMHRTFTKAMLTVQFHRGDNLTEWFPLSESG